MSTKALLTVVAVAEALTGFGLLAMPSTIAALLLGSPLSAGVPLVVGRVAGIALIAIALVCWLERNRGSAAPPTSLLAGLLVYNAAIPLLLIYSNLVDDVSAIGLWPAVALHLAVAIWIVMRLRSQGVRS